MNLKSLILKNISHNIKNYTAYLLGNSFIIGILFMFFNLVFSKAFMNAPNTSNVKENLTSILTLMVAFSLIFIIYTTISFTKYRGKEFGVYFTIGLTSKNIIEILTYENSIIALCSYVFGSVLGTIFSKIVYMATIKILDINNVYIEITFKAYIIIGIIAIIIFVFNTIYQIIFIKRLSIIQILNSSSQKYVGKENSILGVLGVFMLIVSMIIFQKTINNNKNLIIVSVILAVISTYFIIGFIMSSILVISRKFKRFYSNNILFLNSISHKFIQYRLVLYIVTLLVSGAMIFISTTYSMYKSTDEYVNNNYHYDLSFIVQKDLYKENFQNIIKNSGAKIKSYNELEGITVFYLKELKNKVIWNSPQIIVVSESNYNKLSFNHVHINKNHAIFLHSDKADTLNNSGLIIDFPINDKEKSSTLSLFNGNVISLNDYEKVKRNKGYIYIPNDSTVDKVGTMTNYLATGNTKRIAAIIINDDDYNTLKENTSINSISYDILVNLNNNNKYSEIYNTLSNKLNDIGGNSISDTLVLKRKELVMEINNNGFSLFTYSFLGLMMLIGSATVLYFKTFTSLDEDNNRANQLIKIGLTYKEIRNIIIKEIGTIFLVPPIMAITLISYYLTRIYALIQNGDYMWANSIIVFVVYSVIQIIFFILTTNKYLRKIRSNVYL